MEGIFAEVHPLWRNCLLLQPPFFHGVSIAIVFNLDKLAHAVLFLLPAVNYLLQCWCHTPDALNIWHTEDCQRGPLRPDVQFIWKDVMQREPRQNCHSLWAVSTGEGFHNTDTSDIQLRWNQGFEQRTLAPVAGGRGCCCWRNKPEHLR